MPRARLREEIAENEMPTAEDRVLIRGARIIDPANGVDAVGDILVENGRIAAVGKADAREALVVDAKGLVAAPGFVDIHTHLREPGPAGSETVLSGARAAVNGGYTTVCSMPNTDPPVDSVERVAYQVMLGKRAGYARVHPICAVTMNRAGEALVEMAAARDAGAVAFSDDGNCLPTAKIVSLALSYAAVTGLPIIEHAEDMSLTGSGVVHRGAYATLLGLSGIPAAGEDVIVSRDVILARESGGRIHFAHVSTAGSVGIIERAKAEGVAVTAEAAPHHLVLDDSALESFHTVFKVKPPLRSREHVDAVRDGLARGVIDCIATDHAPHRWEDKEVEFDDAAFGMTGLETAFAVLYTQLVEGGVISLNRLIEAMTAAPARCLKLHAGTLTVGAHADITLIDPAAQWLVDSEMLLTKGANCPFEGWKLHGRVETVLVGGVFKKRDGAVL